MQQNSIKYKIISEETNEIWPLEEVKNYLRVSHKNDDKLIGGLVSCAIDYAQKFLGIDFFTKKITCSLVPCASYFRVKYIPIIAIKEVFLISGELKDDITKDFGRADSDNEKIWIAQKYWHQNIEINYEAGWEGNVPRTIMHGILMHIGNMYDVGENSHNISAEIRDMYLPYRYLRV
jgi:hypothetical protein